MIRKNSAGNRNGVARQGRLSVLIESLSDALAVRPSGVTVETLEYRRMLSSTVASPKYIIFHPTKPIGGVKAAAASASPSIYTPALLRTAYGIDQLKFGSVVGDGSGQTIAIVDAYNASTIQSDLKSFDSLYGLADTTLTVVGQTGTSTLPGNDPAGKGDSWEVETSLDVEWAHAVAPKANLLLVEATSDSDANLYAAVDTARKYAGVSVVSMSWGGDESSSDSANDSHFLTPSGHVGVTFLASSGDAGAYSTKTAKAVGYPAVSPNVVGVGGTTLTTDGSGNYTSEAGWGSGTTSFTNGGSGGGISKYFTQPSYQKGVVTQSTTYRTVPDVAMDADPASGVGVIDSWDNGNTTPEQIGGTSLAAPLWAGVMALVNQGRATAGLSSLDGSTQTLPAIYKLPAADFHDVTTGNNGYAAAAGYDLVTGRGTPIVNKLVPDLAGISTTVGAPTIASFAVSPTSVVTGASVSLTASGVTETNGVISGVKFYRESNGTTGLQTATDTLIGSGTQSGTTWTISTSTTGLSAGSYTYYAVATDSTSVSTAASTATLAVTAAPTPSPVIGSFAVSPTSVVTGTSATLTATGVTDAGSTISSVKFYSETNGTTGLQTATDTLIGTGTQSGTTWTISTSTTGLSAGTYTYYAVATDAAAVSSAASSAVLTVTTAPTPQPVFGSFTVNPTSVVTGTPSTLSASVTDAGSTITAVKFYREATSGVQGNGDVLVGTGTQSGSTWSLSTSTAGFVAGGYTYYAVATDAAGVVDYSSEATLTVTAATSTGASGELLGFDVSGQTTYGTQGLAATTVNSSVTNSLGLTRGSGVATSGTAAANAWGGTNWASTSAAGISGNEFITFGLTVAAGKTASLSSIDLNYRRSSTGAQSGLWQYQLNGGTWVTIADVASEFSSTSTSGAAITELSLTGVTALQNLAAGTAVNIRLTPYGSTSTGGTWYVYNKTGDDLVVNATGISASTKAAAPAAKAFAGVFAAATPIKFAPATFAPLENTFFGQVNDDSLIN